MVIAETRKSVQWA